MFPGARLAHTRLFPAIFLASCLRFVRFGALGFWCLRCHHLIRLENEILQFAFAQGVQPVQHDPLVTTNVGCRMNILSLNQFGKGVRRALEAHTRIVQADYDENLSSNFEAKIISPLHVLRGIRKCQAIFANLIHIHGNPLYESEHSEFGHYQSERQGSEHEMSLNIFSKINRKNLRLLCPGQEQLISRAFLFRYIFFPEAEG